MNLFNFRFVRLPAVLYELKQIQEILVNDNQLVELDANGLQKIAGTLITLNVRNNNLQRLPPEICKCTLIKSLDVAGSHFFIHIISQKTKTKTTKIFYSCLGNPFKLPRPATVAKGTQAILEYLKNQLVE